MPIEAIQGLVKSEPLNRNFSFLDSEVGKAVGYISGDTDLTYTGELLTQVTTPGVTIDLSYTGEQLTSVIETHADKTITITLNYDIEGSLIGSHRGVVENGV